MVGTEPGPWPERPAAIERVDDVVRGDVLDDSLVRVKIWTASGRIVYSDEPALIGTTWELGADEQDAMVTGRIVAEVSDLSEPKNEFERDAGTLLEVYLPVRSPAGEVLLFEAYYRYSLVTAQGDRLWRSFAPISLGALVMLELVQLPLAWSLARRLRQRMREREALLHRTLEASDVERRQIASDLHDGVVQDLAGVALALSAASRRPNDVDGDAEVIRESEESVRRSIRDLRSLLVDIYPPNFDEVSLTSGLTDLLTRADEQGVNATLDTESLRDPLPDSVARLIYRAAQEGLRNVLNHAEASTVTVRVGTEGTDAFVEVIDDGRGFDPAVVAESHSSGHVGLSALRGLVADAGGSMVLEPAGGGGTTLRATVPLQ